MKIKNCEQKRTAKFVVTEKSGRRVTLSVFDPR